MRILMLCQRLPYPLNKGEKIRAFHHLRSLSRNHEVTLLSLADEAGDLDAAAVLRRHATEVETVPITSRWRKLRGIAGLPLGQSMTLRYFFSPPLEQRVRALLDRRRFDVVFAYSSAMAQYAERSGGAPVVVDFVDMDSHKWEQYASRKPFPLSTLYGIEASRLRDYEAHVGTFADTVLLVSRAELELFAAIAPGARGVVVPMVVDTEYFTPAGPAADVPSLVFTGVMDYFPNVDAVEYFAREILPWVRAREPRARLAIVGQRPSAAVRRLAELPGVEVTGAVADVRPFMSRAWVAVAPLRIAQGMQTKILEAMAMALPVVATPRAFAGIEAEAGRDVFVEDEPRAFADRVVALLRDPDLRLRTGERARRFVTSHHGPATAAAQLDGVLGAAAERARPRAGASAR